MSIPASEAQTLSQIKSLLAAHGLHPKKRFGQNFLHDHNQLDKILAAAEIQSGDLVLEVGPGTGALTTRLLATGASVLAVEVDTDLELVLRSVFADVPADRFELLVTDVLAGKHELHPLVLERLGDRPFKLIANLPYNVASPLMINLVVGVPTMTQAIVMVQREVTDRMKAEPGGKDYGPLSIMLQAMTTVSRVTTLPPGCFWPPPKIDSAVVQLVRREPALTDDAAALSAMCQKLFSQRRKQLGRILGRDTELPVGLTHEQRPETLSIEQIIQLAEMHKPN